MSPNQVMKWQLSDDISATFNYSILLPPHPPSSLFLSHVLSLAWYPPPDSPALPIWPPHPTILPSIIMPWSPPLTCSILASHSLLRASSAIKAWCFSHFLCSFWASSRAVSRAISIFSSTRCPNHSARGDKNSHHQEPNARASPSSPLSHRTSCLPRRKSHPLCSAGAWVPVLSPPTPTPTRHPFLEKKKIKISTSAAVVAMEALKPFLWVAPGSSCPTTSWVLRSWCCSAC